MIYLTMRILLHETGEIHDKIVLHHVICLAGVKNYRGSMEAFKFAEQFI